jgi:hypothetical protein
MKNMPSHGQILDGLARIANNYSFFATLWHLVFLIIIILLLIGKRPYKRNAGIFLSLPFISVCFLSILTGNPFNAIVFFTLSVFLIFFALKFPAGKIDLKINFPGIIGIAMIIFGWVYPHFLESASLLKYLYASPMGLIPCPTLSLIIGFTLLFQGFSSRKWILTLTIAGLYYGLTGLFSLKVYLDAGLVVGAIVLGMLYFSTKKQGFQPQGWKP